MTAIDDKRSQLPFLGNPVDEGAGNAEMDLGDGRGRARDYQNGSIYWTPQTGAHEVHGAIRVKWAQLGGHRGFLGYPTTDETGTPDGAAGLTTSSTARSTGRRRPARTRCTARSATFGRAWDGSDPSCAIPWATRWECRVGG